jgi:hypothetical protein
LRALFELSRLIARESEFARNPTNPKRGGKFFAASPRKTAEPGSPFFGYFLWRSKESNSPTAKSGGDANAFGAKKERSNKPFRTKLRRTRKDY